MNGFGEEGGESRLKGTLIDAVRRKQQTEVFKESETFAFARVLHAEPRDEDAPPIAKNYGSRNFLFVADGMGGSGSHQVTTGGVEQSEAHVVAHRLSSEIDNKLTTDPNILHAITAQDEARELEKKVLIPLLSGLDAEFADQKSSLAGKMTKRFPTTMSTITISEDDSSVHLKCAWAGDSPIFIITPDAILTTHMSGDGDKPIENPIYVKSAKLDYQDVHLKKGVPFIAICATDAVLKLPGGEFEGAMALISEGLVGKPHLEASSRIQAVYDKLLAAGGEKDDSTISVYLSGNLDKLPDLSNKKSIWSSRKP